MLATSSIRGCVVTRFFFVNLWTTSSDGRDWILWRKVNIGSCWLDKITPPFCGSRLFLCGDGLLCTVGWRMWTFVIEGCGLLWTWCWRWLGLLCRRYFFERTSVNWGSIIGWMSWLLSPFIWWVGRSRCCTAWAKVYFIFAVLQIHCPIIWCSGVEFPDGRCRIGFRGRFLLFVIKGLWTGLGSRLGCDDWGSGTRLREDSVAETSLWIVNIFGRFFHLHVDLL